MKCENKGCGAYKNGVCKLKPLGCCGYMPPEDVSEKFIAKWKKSIGFGLEPIWALEQDQDER